MCLYSQNIKPLVADTDIVVYKHLVKGCEGNVYTPHQDTQVTLGQKFVAKGKLPKLPENYSNNEIGEGVIHAYIDKTTAKSYLSQGEIIVKAVIKADTPFFVQVDMTEIAATEIVLDDDFQTYSEETVKEIEDNLDNTINVIYKLLREQNTHNGVSVGDYVLSDKSIVAPDALTKNMDVIGIISFFTKDGTPNVTALKQTECIWGRMTDSAVNAVNSREKSVEDFNGADYTKKLYETYKDRLNDFPALKYCVEYETKGTKKGDWVFGSSGEVLQTVRNAYLINRSIEKLNEVKDDCGYADEIIIGMGYWSSAEYDGSYAWDCYTNVAYCYYSGLKRSIYYVRPSLALGKTDTGLLSYVKRLFK